MAKQPRIRLGILFGGKSGEHEVSLVSAASVISALDPGEFEITAIGITKSGQLASAREIRAMLPAPVHERVSIHPVLEAAESRMKMISSSSASPDAASPPEIIFPLLHGPYGEDGTIQGLLEIAGVPYIGCGVLASAVGMDKDVMKRLFLQAGLPVAAYRAFPSRQVRSDLESLREVVAEELGYPLFSKPANLGSSVGVCKIRSEQEFEEAVLYSAQFDRKILIERAIDARELECGILGNDDAKASVVGEVLPSREFYDYQAKYGDTGSRLEIPARITEEQEADVRGLALHAFRAIDASGLARVDFLMDRLTCEIYVNEINTMPGFTPISMYSKLWAASGVSFAELVRRLVQYGRERHRESEERRISADS